jgi:signal transduction histidine kinase
MARTDASGRDLSAMMEQMTTQPEHYVNNNNENILRNGQKVWISWTNRAVYGADGKLREVFCVGNDITGIKEAEKAMARAKEAAESANRAKSTFLATMSHELRTPLTVVMGYSELLGEGVAGALSDKQKEYCHHIYDSGKHLLSLINDILDLSKVEAGKMDLELSRFDLKETLGKCFVLLGDSAKKRGIEFSENIDPAVGFVTADERKVRQVLFNLLSNAVKFTPDRGKIELSAKKIDGGMILISVADSGIGIDPKDADKVFEEFKQIDNEYSRKYAGTGLGMPLSKKFVELHGGKIWFESDGKGHGSRFYVTLPEKAVMAVAN